MTQRERNLLGIWEKPMQQMQQDPLWHGEGDVWTHTDRVCRALESLPEFREAGAEAREVLGLAALLHDVGKLRTTRREDGRIVSPGHAGTGAEMARQKLWLEENLCGTEAAQQRREAVCGLIRHHSLPLHAIDEADGKLRLLRFAANGALAPEWTVKNLCILAKADVLGRICGDQAELLEKIALCGEMARELGCFDGPYPFSDDATRFAYLSGRNVAPDYPVYDDTWGEVVLLSGLPGTGKDTWIRENCPEIPMISLDEIRRELGIDPGKNQSAVVEAGRQQAREYLRRHQRFVWNATDLSPMVRGRQTGLFCGYGASVRIVYLETAWAEQLRRNQNRPNAVPDRVVWDMLEVLTPPQIQEARRVEWLCV